MQHMTSIASSLYFRKYFGYSSVNEDTTTSMNANWKEKRKQTKAIITSFKYHKNLV